MSGPIMGESPRRSGPQRPRDALGRPLAFGEVGVEPVPDDPLPPREALSFARSLVQEGRAFAAHEVLEARWKAAPELERPLWQGLAQLCVAITHAARGNDIGAQRLLQRGAERVLGYGQALREHASRRAYGLDLEAVVTCARECVTTAQLDRDDGTG